MRLRSTILLLILLLLPCTLDAQPGRPISRSMIFAPLPVGASKEMEVRITGLQGTGGFVVSDSCTDPFTMRTKMQDLRIRNGEISIQVEFNPLSPGDFSDELVLVRMPALGPMNDVIRIRLFGTAFRVIRDEKIDFDQVLTGDSSRRIGFIRAHLNQNVRWDLMGKIDPPFELLTRNGPILVGGDTLAFAFSFQPTSVGSFLDTIGLIRVFKLGQGVPLDTMLVHFMGEGVQMPSEKTVNFSNMNIGMISRDTVVIDLPVRPIAVPFSYSVVPKDAPVSVSARILTPVVASKDQKIFVEFTCAPIALDSTSYGFVVLRTPANGQPVDSTIVVASVVVSPRPVTFQLGFTSDTLRQRIGDTIDVDVLAYTSDPIDLPLAVTSLSCTLTYNPTMVVPLLSSGQSVAIVEDLPHLTIGTTGSDGSFELSISPQTIASVRFVVTLGDAEQTPLAMLKATYMDQQGVTKVLSIDTALLVVTNVWRYQDGTQRFVNPFVGTLVADVDPNPVISQSTLSIRNVPAQAGRLTVIDVIGQIRADLTVQLRSGKQEFLISSGGSADVSLTPGTYYVRLIVEGASGNSINSVVRVFVVQ